MDFSIVILVLWAVSLLWYRRAAVGVSKKLATLEEEVKQLKDHQADFRLKSAGVRRSVGTSHFNN